MSVRCLLLITAFGLVTVAGPGTASAQEPAQAPSPLPPRLRLHLEGGLGGYVSYVMQMPDGSRASPTCSPQLLPALCRVTPALGLGIDWSPFPRFGVGLRSRWVPALAGGASILGRRLYVAEALLVPQVSLPWTKRVPRGGARPYVAAPVGVAWSYQSRGWERAVQEDWNSRPGLSAGLAFGLELYWGRRWGTLVELDYQARFLSADVVSTPVADPTSRATERVSVVQQQILVSVGVLFALPQAVARGE